jgi:hypothetical protein
MDACQNPYLLSTVLRQQFGFGGFVTSDWEATHSTAASANAGLDQDMPGDDGYFGSALQSAVSSGTASTAVTNTGSRAGADVAQLYVSDPSAAGEPPRQLEGFARVNLQPGASQTVSFPLTQRSLSYWSSSNTWATATGNYGIAVGDSDANLPLTGTLAVTSAQLGQPVTITSPGPQEGTAGTAVSVPVSAADSTSGQSLNGLMPGVPVQPETHWSRSRASTSVAGPRRSACPATPYRVSRSARSRCFMLTRPCSSRLIFEADARITSPAA